MFYNELADRMRFLKQDEECVKMASKIVEEYGDIRAAEALQQGIQQKAIEDAKNFLAMKILTAEQVAQGTGLPLEEVLELQKTI